jgi:hypothetical protein
MRRETEAFLNLVRDAEDPTRADEVRVQRALRAAIAAGVAPSVAPGAPEGTWFGEALSKLGLSGAKLNMIAALAALTLATGDADRPRGGADAGGVLSASSTAVPDPAATALLEPAPAESRAPRLAPAPAVPDPAVPDAATPAPRASALERAKPRARTAAAKAPARAAPAAASNLRAELDLLQRVQAALKRGDAAFALHELEAHRTEDSTLLAERRAARILALCQLGRIADARRAAAVFAEQHPDSLQRAAVDGSCANR